MVIWLIKVGIYFATKSYCIVPNHKQRLRFFIHYYYNWTTGGHA